MTLSIGFSMVDEFLACTVTHKKEQFENHSVDKVERLWCYKVWIKEKILQVLNLCIFLNFRSILDEISVCANLPSHLRSRVRGILWRPENTANTWNLRWLSRQLIICTEQTSSYISTFSNTFDLAKNHEISIHFPTNAFVAMSHSKFKMRWFPDEASHWAEKLWIDNNLPPLMPDEDSNFVGSLGLDFKK